MPILVACLSDQDSFVRWNAAVTLGEMGQAAETALPALLLALHDRDDGVQMHAARALGITPAAFRMRAARARRRLRAVLNPTTSKEHPQWHTT